MGCYGYHRATTPNCDAIARKGVRFDNVHVSDAPCLPSRTALWSGRHGIHTGVINHGGAQADFAPDGVTRGFSSSLGRTNWNTLMRRAMGKNSKACTISPFGERHSAFHWYAGFNEIYNTGKGGQENADEVSPVAIDWLKRNAKNENWFLHVNFWDPHTPYRVPAAFGDPFAGEPTPDWLTEEVRQEHWRGCGAHSAQEIPGFTNHSAETAPHSRQPKQAATMADVRAMFDGYDTGVLYADTHLGYILNALADENVLDETAIIISADHGENLGELNIYGDHQTADQMTTHVPLILHWPGVTEPLAGTVNRGLQYQFDMAATVVDLLGGNVPALWDGQSFADDLRGGGKGGNGDGGRPYLVVSQGAWACQRGVRFDDWLCLRSYHDGYHGLPDVMLFDINADPHEQNDLAPERPDVVARAMHLLDNWQGNMMATATHGVDPMRVVMQEGGPLHTRGHLPAYLKRLRETGREDRAQWLATRYPKEAAPNG